MTEAKNSLLHELVKTANRLSAEGLVAGAGGNRPQRIRYTDNASTASR